MRNRPRSSRAIQPAPAAIMRYWSAVLRMRRVSGHGSSLILAVAVALAPRAAGWQGPPPPDPPSTLEFTVLSRGQAVGSQTITVTKSSTDFTITALGNIGAPFDLSTSRFQLKYSADWQPLSFSVEGLQSN